MHIKHVGHGVYLTARLPLHTVTVCCRSIYEASSAGDEQVSPVWDPVRNAMSAS